MKTQLDCAFANKYEGIAFVHKDWDTDTKAEKRISIYPLTTGSLELRDKNGNALDRNFIQGPGFGFALSINDKVTTSFIMVPTKVESDGTVHARIWKMERRFLYPISGSDRDTSFRLPISGWRIEIFNPHIAAESLREFLCGE